MALPHGPTVSARQIAGPRTSRTKPPKPFASRRSPSNLAKMNATPLARGGDAIAYAAGQVEVGAIYIDRALALNPNLAFAWFASAWVNIWLGNPYKALEHLKQVARLSSLDPFMSGVSVAFAHFFAGRYDEASSCAEQVLRERSNFHMALRMAAASHAMAHRLQPARNALASLREIDPALCVSSLRDLTPIRRPEDIARYAEGLRKAGLPP